MDAILEEGEMETIQAMTILEQILVALASVGFDAQVRDAAAASEELLSLRRWN